MGEGTDGTSIEMPTFDSNAANYQRFKLRFREYSNAKNFILILSRPSISSAIPRITKISQLKLRRNF